jgi:DNA-binding transcriptional regulator LsrR (DeoR family)
VRLAKAAERVRKADATASHEREKMMRMVRDEFNAGRVTKSGIARALGVSRQRVQKMLED